MRGQNGADITGALLHKFINIGILDHPAANTNSYIVAAVDE